MKKAIIIITLIFVATVSTGHVMCDNGPAPNSGDGISDGSGLDSHVGPNSVMKATLSSPSGQAEDSTPIYSWAEDPASTWYKLFVWDNTEEKIYAKWYKSSDICLDGNCSVTPESELLSSSYEWWVKSWNDYGSIWSDGMAFAVQGDDSPPSKVIHSSPSETIQDSTPTFIWIEEPASTWYKLWVGYPKGDRIFGQWYAAADICSGGSCSVTLESELSNGSYEWWIKSWNDYGKVWSDGSQFRVSTSQASEEITIDHMNTDITKIPVAWLNTVKNKFRISYAHTSHGSQIITGMEVLQKDAKFSFTTDGFITSGSLSIDDYAPGGDLGHGGDTSWANRTRHYLDNSGSDRNVVIWSWCGGVSDNTQAGIQAYLDAMNQLESEYPNVTFVYMTGHLDGTGASGNLHLRNTQIRQYCQANGKILYDFADIETYDPDGISFLNLYADDECYYDGGSGNWAQEWCAANPEDSRCINCDCAHSEPLNCYQKAGAFWWMLARIAGWGGL